MSGYPTDLYVATQSLRQMIVVDPPYRFLSTIFVTLGILAILLGIILLVQFRVGFSRGSHALIWLLPFAIGAPFLVTAAFTGRTSHIILSADSDTLSVRKSLLSVRLGSREYPLTQVRLVRVGVGNVCRFLYVSLTDQPAENLTSCTDRTGYSEVADAMNAFLDANRHAALRGAHNVSSSIP